MRMRNTREVRYFLFALIFALVILGVILKSYALLVAMVVVSIVLSVFADKLENAPSEPYKGNNKIHDKSHKHDV